MPSIRGEIAEGIARASAAAFIAVVVTGCTGVAMIWCVINQLTLDLIPGEWWVLQGGVIAWVFKENVHKPPTPPENPA